VSSPQLFRTSNASMLAQSLAVALAAPNYWMAAK
jgi:hypothetical protein